MGEMGYPVLGSVGVIEYLQKQIPAFGIAEGGDDGGSFDLERQTGFEPATCGLGSRRSTN